MDDGELKSVAEVVEYEQIKKKKTEILMENGLNFICIQDFPLIGA